MIRTVSLAIVFIAVAVALASGPADNQAMAATSAALKVDQSVIRVGAQAGEKDQSTFIITSEDEAADITIEVRGFVQGEDGSFGVADPGQDENPFSAVDYISVTPERFHLAANESRAVDITTDIPLDAGDGARYAVILVTTDAVTANSEGAKTRTAIGVNYIASIRETTFTRTGAIDSLEVGEARTNEPISVNALVTNTGNSHYQLQTRATLTDLSGEVFAISRTQQTRRSLVPSYSQQIELALYPSTVMAEGDYFVEFEFFDDSNVVLDRQRVGMEIARLTSFESISTPAAESSFVIERPPVIIQQGGGSAIVPWIGLLGGLLGAGLVGAVAFLWIPRRMRAQA